MTDLKQLNEIHRAGQLDEAKAGYLALLRKNPHEVEALHALGIIAAQQDRLDDAVDYLQQAIRQQPDNPALVLHLANLFKIQSKFEQAIALLTEIIKKHPDYIPAYNNIGTIYFNQGKWIDAIQWYERTLAQEPNYIDARYNLGLAHAKNLDFKTARDTFQTLLQQAPEHFAARFHLACILMQLNQMKEANKEFLTIEKTHPHHLETQTNLATTYLKLGDSKKAREHYLKALELAPEDTQILFNLGVVNNELGDLDLSIRYYQKVVQLKPDFFPAHNNVGVAFLAKQHISFALQHFREALRIQPNNKSLQYTVQTLSQNQRLSAAPTDYVQTLFDAYADHYEPHLLNALDYQVPQLLHHAVLPLLPAHARLDILDLGCGTGLCGAIFKSNAKSLVGVDLSTKMLEIAAEKQIYDELATDNLEHFLQNKIQAYDLILAGDVLVYIGDLDNLIGKISVALKPGGLFAFNTEISLETDYKMNQSGRFAHQKNYLDLLAEQHHLTIRTYQTVVTRQQNNEPVHGHLYILQRSS